ncbi:SAM-dependent methyltransferase [Tessaracoccus antarcticus]|uniref:Methyltransferase domain-containing protein n=1 Tax=Tessaracoccus antarcticus TaxID=2479848 RepID=A0A3M0G1P8_9ACTN|nr:SAM-dependent methyltransferase [Tessaracoccus antarcticus]RMB58910.1 hypothetical protein EAX62_12425 [Tessaracoccus antarcticus]
MGMNGGPALHHADEGTSEEAWGSEALLKNRPALDLSGVSHLVVVAAHPADETIMAGGLIAEAHRLGLRVDVVVAEALRPVAPSSGLHSPGLGDGDGAESHDALVRLLVDLVGTRGEETLMASPWRGDGHPEHEAAALAAASAAWRTGAGLLECPIAFRHGGTPSAPLPAGPCLFLSGHARRARAAAMQAHHSQVKPLNGAPDDASVRSTHLLPHFDGGVELYFDAAAGEVNPFDALHSEHPDPWQVRSSWYEARKRSMTLAALPRPRYRRAVELGCSVGALTSELAGRADHVLAVDESAAALRSAAAALADLPHVQTKRLRVPEELDAVDADLVVISEVGYFLSPLRLRDLARRVADSGCGTVLACHWRHEIVGWPLDGPAVHTILRETLRMPSVVRVEDVDFVLEVFSTDAGARA